MRIIIGFKKREKPIPEFEQLGQAIDELKKAIMESYIGNFLYKIMDIVSIGRR